MLAVTGISGVIGREVAARLTDAGREVRGITRDPRRAPDLEGTEVVEARYHQTTAVRRALDGVETVFMVPLPDKITPRIDEQAEFVAAVAHAGVKDVVYLSFEGAQLESPHAWSSDHTQTEALLEDFGIATTILRTNFRVDALRDMSRPGDIRGPAGRGRIVPVSNRDVVDVAAAVLLDRDAHQGATYRLTGPAALTMDEIAAAIGVAEDRPCSYVDESVEELHRRFEGQRVPQHVLDAWTSICEAIAADCFAEVTTDVERLLGRTPEDVTTALSA